MENRSKYFIGIRRTTLTKGKINRLLLKEMKSEILKEFLKSEDVFWNGSVRDKNGYSFKPKTVGEIKKGFMFALSFHKQKNKAMYCNVEFSLDYFVISVDNVEFILNLSNKWKKFLEDFLIAERNEIEF